MHSMMYFNNTNQFALQYAKYIVAVKTFSAVELNHVEIVK